MKKKAVIIDTYSHGSYHEVINQSYLMMISELYEEVTYIADNSACQNLMQMLKRCNVNYDNIHFIEKTFKIHKVRNAGVSYLIHLLQVSWANFMLYRKCSKGTDVFFNNNLFFAITLITLFARKDKNIYDMCHNEMELIDKKTASSICTKFISAYFRFIFRHIKLNQIFHFILLSDSMVEYFRGFISTKNRSRIYSIDHAYIRPENPFSSDDLITDSRLKVGIPGAISEGRGLPELKKLLKILDKDICIYALSTCSGEIESNQFVKLNDGKGLLPFEKYNAYVQSMDVMLLLYQLDSYKLTASGAILEAIWNEKPIYGLKNKYFSYLFQKFGDMGYLASSIEDLSQALKTHKDEEKLKTLLHNIHNAKLRLMPNKVKEQLKEIIEQSY